MIDIYLWGAGHIADLALLGAEDNNICLSSNMTFNIKGIIDNDLSKRGCLFHGFKIVSPGEAI